MTPPDPKKPPPPLTKEQERLLADAYIMILREIAETGKLP